jgi:hypothetical protein
VTSTTSSAVDSIEQYVTANGRPFDVARLQHVVRSGSAQAVVAALADFQNEDGGFGHGLESDLRLPDSSPICTWVALGHLRQLKIPAQELMVCRALDYLQASYDTDAGRWLPVSAAVNAYPHAAWWHFEADKGGTDIHKTPWNPTAALTGYLWHYGFSGSVSLDALSEGVITYLRSKTDTDLEMHELRCLVQLAELAPEPHAGPLRELTTAAVERIIERERGEWDGYGAQPLIFVEDPDSFLYEALKDVVDDNLTYVLETLGDDGAWKLPYQWYRDEEEFERLRPEITASYAVHRICVLRAFGRL